MELPLAVADGTASPATKGDVGGEGLAWEASVSCSAIACGNLDSLRGFCSGRFVPPFGVTRVSVTNCLSLACMLLGGRWRVGDVQQRTDKENVLEASVPLNSLEYVI